MRAILKRNGNKVRKGYDRPPETVKVSTEDAVAAIIRRLGGTLVRNERLAADGGICRDVKVEVLFDRLTAFRESFDAQISGLVAVLTPKQREAYIEARDRGFAAVTTGMDSTPWEWLRAEGGN